MYYVQLERTPSPDWSDYAENRNAILQDSFQKKNINMFFSLNSATMIAIKIAKNLFSLHVMGTSLDTCHIVVISFQRDG